MKIVKKSGETTLVAVYGRERPELKRDHAGAIITMMERTFGKANGTTFGVFDAETGKLHKSKTNMSKQILDHELTFIFQRLRALF